MTNRGGYESSSSIAQKLVAFVRESKRNILLQRITKVMAVFVVFVTTYMLILPAITLSSSDLPTDSTLEIISISASNVVYDGEEYTADLTVEFSNITNADASTTYYVILPDGIDVTNYTGSTLTGTSTINGETVNAFTYKYVEGDDGVWYAEITFLQSYLDAAGDDLEDGWLYFSAVIDSSYEVNDDLVITNNEGTVTYTTIPATKITTTDDSSNPAGDVEVSKSGSSYDAETNSITYTITVSSDKGTQGAISLVDTITTALNVESVEIDSIELRYVKDEWGNYETVSTETGSSSLIQSSDYDDSTGIFTITLDALTEGSYGYGSKYVITYTVYLDDITDYTISETVKNSVTASADTGWTGTTDATVTSTSPDVTKTVSYNLLSKTGSVDSNGVITWTITINASGVDISGWTLTDDMFGRFYDYQLKDCISGGNYGSDYTFTVDSSGYVTAIHFNNVSGTDSNTNTYTITYTTAASSTWGAGEQDVTNTAVLTDGTSYITVGPTVTVQSGGIEKTIDESKTSYNSDGSLVYLTWTTTGTVPSGGITSGTTLYDYLGGSDAYTTQITQWLTYSQITSDNSSAWYSIILSGIDNTTTSLIYGSDYELYFYCQGTGEWVKLSALASDPNTYSDYKFTAFYIEFLKDVALSARATFSWTYTTTADRSTIDGTNVSSITYENSVEVIGESGLSDSASHTEYAYVVKTDGSGKQGTSSTTVGSDGTLTWIVKVFVPAGSTDTYTITDTLPTDVTLVSAKVAVSYLSCTLTPDTDGNLSGTISDGAITGTVVIDTNGQIVTINVPSGAYSWVGESGYYIIITYTCELDEELLVDENDDPLENGTVIGTYGNTVTVSTSGGTSYDPVEQEQEVSYYEKTEEPEDNTVSKEYTWSQDTSILTYTVVINPDEETLASGENLSFEDVLTVNHEDTWGVYAQLVSGTVKFYEAVSDGNGGYTKGDELDIAWTYTQSSAEYSDYISVYHTIASSSIPDATAIILEYQYEIWLDPFDESAYKAGTTSYNITGVGNKMTLAGEYSDSTNTTNADSYSDSHMSAGIGATENSFTLVKVEEGNYSITLANAVYTLYKWNSTDLTWDAVRTYTTGSNGEISVGESEIDADIAYKLVETTAPTGYFLDSTTEYYFYKSSDSGTVVYPSDGWDYVSAINLTKTSGTEYAEDEPVPDDQTTSITAEKQWVDSNGDAITDTDKMTEITLEVYQYETTSTASSGTGQDDDSVTVYIYNGNPSFVGYNPGSVVMSKSVPKDTAVTITLTSSVYYWYYIGESASPTGYDTSSSLTIAANDVTDDIYFCVSNITADSVSSIMYDGENTSGGSGSSAIYSPTDQGTSIGTVTVSLSDTGEFTTSVTGSIKSENVSVTSASNGVWTIVLNDLDYLYYEYDDSSGTYIAHYYYYYFVESSVDGYVTTYSTADGVTGNGTITITNTQIPTTEISVTKKWYDESGNEITDISNVTFYDSDGNEITDDSEKYILVDLYRTTTAAETAETETVTVSVYDTSKNLILSQTVPKGKTVYISGNVSGYTTVQGWTSDNESWTDFYYNSSSSSLRYTFTLTELENDIAYYLQGMSDISISYEGEGASSTTYTDAELPTDGEYVGTYTLGYDSETQTYVWTIDIEDLPAGYVENGIYYTYYYYFRENTVRGYTTSYDSAGSTDGTITITNTYDSTLLYTKAEIQKTWLDSSGAEITDLSDYTASFQIWQALYDESSSAYVTDEDGNILLIPYRAAVELSASTGWSLIWANLPTTASYNGTTYTCVYFVTEVAASDGNTTTFTTSYSASTETTSGISNIVVYDTYNVTVLATYYFVTYGNTTGDNTNPTALATVEITNKSSDEEEDSISITVEKTWVKNGAAFDMTEATVTVKLLQVLTATGEKTLYNQSSDTDIAYTKTITFTGSSIGETSWTELPATLTVEGVEYTCTYYIVEVSAENGSGTSILDKYTVSYTITNTNGGSGSTADSLNYTDSTSGETVTYYAVSNGETITITNTATDSIVLPVTGGHGIRNLILIAGSTLMLFAIAVILARQRRIKRWSSA